MKHVYGAEYFSDAIRAGLNIENFGGVGIDEDGAAAQFDAIRAIGGNGDRMAPDVFVGKFIQDRGAYFSERKGSRAGSDENSFGVEQVGQFRFKGHDAAGDAEDCDKQAGNKGNIEMKFQEQLAHVLEVENTRSALSRQGGLALKTGKFNMRERRERRPGRESDSRRGRQ